MFFGLEWYWWMLLLALLVISVPLKIGFLTWWNKRRQEKKKEKYGKWGDEE